MIALGMIKYLLIILSLALFPFEIEAKSSCQKKLRRKKHRLKIELLAYRFIPAFCTEENQYFYKLGQWSAYTQSEELVRRIHRRKRHGR
jgi:hypothetical protein